MDLATAQYLVTDAGQQLLADVDALPGDAASRVLTLRKRGVPERLAGGAAEIAGARRRAAKRFPDAARLFWTDDALAQATSPLIAQYHAGRLAPYGVVADLGCGVAIDAIYLARAGASVIAIDKDPVRLVFARENAARSGVDDRIEFREGDVTAMEWEADAAYWDPSRRSGDRRVSRHADLYEPPLSFLDDIRGRVRAGGIKLSPALPDDVLASLDGTVEFLSERGECKEAAVWFGDAAGSSPGPAAVLLPEGLSIPAGDDPLPVALSMGDYIHDPDAAIVRAGALGALCSRTGTALIDGSDVYLTSDSAIGKPLASSYRVLMPLPYRPKALRPILRERGIGRIVVKKRHFPKEPDEVARELSLSGTGSEVTLILVRSGKGHLAVLAEPVPAPAASNPASEGPPVA